jgi:thiol-disulfide isomerase/thioredoxin
LDTYFKYYIPPHPDSTYKEVKYILLMARTNKEMYAYLLIKFTNKYMNPEFMGQDEVFVNLFKDFYATGDTTFLNAASKKTIIERAYTLMANLVGNQGAELNLTDTSGNKISLYNTKAKFVFLAFWDPSCSHCKTEIPQLDSLYKAKWKGLNVKIYSVNVKENSLNEFKSFIKEKKLSSDWTQVYQSKEERETEQAAGQMNFRQSYDVFKTPTFYLLDEQKRIIAKQLTLEQFDGVIAAKLKDSKK